MFEAKFQTFDDPMEAQDVPSRLLALRAELARRGLDGFIVPHADRHQNEYLPPNEERLAWLTGFTGIVTLSVLPTVLGNPTNTAIMLVPVIGLWGLVIGSWYVLRWVARQRYTPRPMPAT